MHKTPFYAQVTRPGTMYHDMESRQTIHDKPTKVETITAGIQSRIQNGGVKVVDAPEETVETPEAQEPTSKQQGETKGAGKGNGKGKGKGAKEQEPEPAPATDDADLDALLRDPDGTGGK